MSLSTRVFTPLVLLAVSAGGLLSQQAVPATQPPLLDIYVEEVALGREAAHAANEAGWGVHPSMGFGWHMCICCVYSIP